MTLSEQAEREVVDLHEFFEAWMGGDDPEESDRPDGSDDPETASFDRAAAVLPDDFEIVSPSGERRDGPTIRSDVRDARGAFADSDPPLRIEATTTRTRFDDGERCLVTYEEWQRHDGDWEGRYSSALFRRNEDAPNGVEWVHLHETWLPQGAEPPTG